MPGGNAAGTAAARFASVGILTGARAVPADGLRGVDDDRVQRDFGGDAGAVAVGALDDEPAVERSDAIGETAQPDPAPS